MRLLILTQAVDLDDPVLGFFHRWIAEFATRCDSIEAICLKEGRHDLPENVHVHSLGKESGASRIKYVLNFYRYIWKLRGSYDAVFVHMNAEYVLLAGVLWRLRKNRIVMWYVHRQRSWKLLSAVMIANAVCTTAQESISITSPKIKILGHGIDIQKYTARVARGVNAQTPKIVSVGRITPIKDLGVIIQALAHLRQRGIDASLDLIGSPTVKSDYVYEKNLHELTAKLGLAAQVSFLGSVKNEDMPEIYSHYDLSVNACPTGGIDKAVLESMASGLPVFVANIAFRSYLGDLVPDLMFAYGNADDLTSKILAFLDRTDTALIQEKLRARAREEADVSRLILAIMKQLYGTS